LRKVSLDGRSERETRTRTNLHLSEPQPSISTSTFHGLPCKDLNGTSSSSMNLVVDHVLQTLFESKETKEEKRSARIRVREKSRRTKRRETNLVVSRSKVNLSLKLSTGVSVVHDFETEERKEEGKKEGEGQRKVSSLDAPSTPSSSLFSPSKLVELRKMNQRRKRLTLSTDTPCSSTSPTPPRPSNP